MCLFKAVFIFFDVPFHAVLFILCFSLICKIFSLKSPAEFHFLFLAMNFIEKVAFSAGFYASRVLHTVKYK